MPVLGIEAGAPRTPIPNTPSLTVLYAHLFILLFLSARARHDVRTEDDMEDDLSGTPLWQSLHFGTGAGREEVAEIRETARRGERTEKSRRGRRDATGTSDDAEKVNRIEIRSALQQRRGGCRDRSEFKNRTEQRYDVTNTIKRI